MNRHKHSGEAQAVILAAGYGRRMRPLTNHVHKTLLKIGSKTVIQMIIDSLLLFGIDRITIVTGYREGELKAYLAGTYPSLHITYIYNERYEQTNNIYSMALALDSLPLDRDIVLIESDLIYDPAVLKRLLDSPHENVALVDRWRPGMDGTVVAVNADDQAITSIIPPHLQGSGFNFSDKFKTLNIYRFSRDFCSRILKRILSYYAKAINDNCYYELILGILIYMNDVRIYAEVLDGEKWTEIDDPNDLDIARFVFDQSAERELLDSSFGGYWRYDILDFRFIRNMHFPTGAILSELKNNLAGLLFNYGSRQGILNRKLATFLLLDNADRVNALNGLSQVFPLLRDYLAGKRILIPEPSFGEYSRLFPDSATYSDRVGFRTSEILEKLDGCDAVVFVNPNNPTGSQLPTEWIYELAASHPETLVIVDESFIAFSGQDGVMPLLEAKSLGNVLVLTSLSKILGVPGLRLGYTYSANGQFNDYLRARIPIWNMNSMAEYFLEVILKHREALKRSIALTVEDRRRFESQLRKLPLVNVVHPSGGNYLLVSLDCEPARMNQIVDELLLKHRVYIKDTSAKLNLPGSHVRVAVRTAEENRRFVQCFRKAVVALEQ
jgi:histidinol-phosphate/aromatic aminotransferase/cobyric acid decarboxylase-like protein/choline kinase